VLTKCSEERTDRALYGGIRINDPLSLLLLDESGRRRGNGEARSQPTKYSVLHPAAKDPGLVMSGEGEDAARQFIRFIANA
jgi:hypothetical protein